MRRFISSLVAASILAFVVPSAATSDASFRIVTHPQVKGTQIPRATLGQIFLRQAPRWGDGTPVVPVDQSLKSPLRGEFSNRVLGQGIMEVQIYWQRKMLAGVVPPPVKSSDLEVLAFVAANPGAIGYVSSATALPDDVKTIEVTNYD